MYIYIDVWLYCKSTCANMLYIYSSLSSKLVDYARRRARDWERHFHLISHCAWPTGGQQLTGETLVKDDGLSSETR